MRRRAILCLAVGLAGLLVFHVPDHGIAPIAADPAGEPLAAAALSLRWRRGVVEVAGHSVDEAHEQALRQRLETRFSAAQKRITLVPHVLLPAHWRESSLAAIDVVAGTHSADAMLDASGLSIDAVVTDAPGFERALERLEGRAPIEVSADAIEVMTSTATSCAELFDAVSRDGIRFDLASDRIRSASWASLGRLADMMRLCPGTELHITGHTDAVGDAAWNRGLSLARARAVAEHLAALGIERRRLIEHGAGAGRPVADNDTPFGRSRNRRIELELRAAGAPDAAGASGH